MKILVVDDTQYQRDAAVEQFNGEHELTVCSTFEEARTLLWPDNPRRNKNEPLPTFDALLTDYLMPAESSGLSANFEKFKGILMPYGILLAHIALNTSATIKVGILSGGDNHHSHPMVWAADSLCGHRTERLLMAIGDRVGQDHQEYFVYYDCDEQLGGIKAIKDWKRFLDDVMEKTNKA